MWGSAGRRRIIRQSASWEEQAFARDAAANANLGGCVWPPRFYTCSFCQREFRSAQALGGHMNVHRRDRARLRQRQTSSSSSPSHQEEEAEAPQDQQAGPYYTSFSKPSTTSTDNTTCSNDILLLARDQETIKKRVPRQQVQIVADQDEDEPAGRRYKRRRLDLVDQLPSSCEGGDHHHQVLIITPTTAAASPSSIIASASALVVGDQQHQQAGSVLDLELRLGTSTPPKAVVHA